MTKDEHESLKNNSNIVITNKIIAFWSRILQISNICDIGKYVEIKKYKIGTNTIIFSIIIGLIVYYFILHDDYMIKLLSFLPTDISLQYYRLRPKDKQNLAFFISFAPFVIIMILFLLERIKKKEYYFRISMSGGQVHYISSNSEEFIDDIMRATIFAMDKNDAPITFVGNIDNSSVIEGSNIIINSKVQDSFSKK